MFNDRKTMTALSIAGLVLTSYGGEFTLKKADHEMLLKRGMGAWEMGASSLQDVLPQSMVKVPDGVVEPKWRSFVPIPGTPIPLLVYKSSADAKTFDRVIVDQADNKDFTDDPVLTFGTNLPVNVTLKLNGRDTADYRIYLVSPPVDAPRRGWDVALLPVLWREGTVTLEGKPVRAMMARGWEKRILLFDSDGDGPINYQSKYWFEVTTYVKIDNTFYKTVLGPSVNDLDFEPFNGPFGKLSLTGDMAPQGNKGRISLELRGSTGAEKKRFHSDLIVQTALTNQPIVIPAGKYGISDGYAIAQGPNGKHVNFTVENNLVIRPDQVTLLNLGKPKPDLVVVQEERTLSINRVMVFVGNPVVTYSMAPEGESEDTPPTIDVVDATDPAKIIVARTSMEYGGRDSCGCSVSIPETVKAGQKLLVRLQKGTDTSRIVKEFVVK